MSGDNRSSSRNLAPIATSIEVLRRQMGLGRGDTISALTASWSEVAGEQVSRHSTVIDLRQGILTVDAHDPATAEVLTWSKQRLLTGVREVCPAEEIVDITVRVRRAARVPKG